jgi:hypothetical protein
VASASNRKGAESAFKAGEQATWRARERSLGLASVFQHTAHTLDQSADLAEEHARRHERHGKQMAAEQEWRVAARARTAAGQARAHAAELQSADR